MPVIRLGRRSREFSEIYGVIGQRPRYNVWWWACAAFAEWPGDRWGQVAVYYDPRTASNLTWQPLVLAGRPLIIPGNGYFTLVGPEFGKDLRRCPT